MSLLHPENAEDRMAWMPIIGCLVPLALVIGAVIYIVWRFIT